MKLKQNNFHSYYSFFFKVGLGNKIIMAAKNLLEIVIQAVNKDVGKVTKQVKDQFKSMGDVANSSMNQASKSSEQVTKALNTISKNLDISKKQLQSIGVDGTSSFAKLTNAQKGAILNAKHFETATIQDINKVKELANGALKWKDQMELAQLQIQATGGKVDTLKGKFQTVGIALESSFISKIDPIRNKFESIKTTITGVAGTVTQKLSAAFNPITSKVTNLASNIQKKLGSAVKSVGTAVKNLGQKFSGLGGIISSAVGALGMASISQLTIGLAMTREQMRNLTSATMGSTSAANHFVDVMDKMTNNSLVSLNDLGSAMNTIKISTGVTNAELEKLLPTVNDIGQRAILMGKNSDEAMNMMTAAGKGLNGEFDILKSNFGVTKESLKDLGWKGTTEDVEGYIKALDKYMEKAGSMDSMMQTTTGKIASVKKGFTAAGRQIGEVFLPYINQALDGFLNLQESSSNVSKGIIMIGAAISGAATVFPMIEPTISTFNSLSNGVSNAKKMISGIGDTLSTAKSAIDGFKTAQEGAAVATKLLAASTLGLSTEEAVLSATNAGLTMEQYESLLASNLQAAGYTEVATAAEGAAVAEGMALLPLLAIAAAIGGVIVVAYELGKAFGWWTDAGSMIDAISAGVQRLWSAFINNPDVKSMIQGITSAFQWLAGVLQSVGQWILSVCGITEEAGDKFDIVRGIIDVLGASFHQIKIFIDGVVSALTRVWEAVSNNEDVQIVVDALVFGFQTLYSTISWVVGVISEFVSGLFSSNDAGTQAQENFDTLGFIMEIVGGAFHLLVQHLTNLYNIFMFVVGCIQNTISFFQWLYDVVINIPTAFQNMISFVSVFLSQLPTIVYSYLVSVVRYIVVAGSQWINNAINIARNTVNGVIKWICQLPGRIYSYIVSVGSRILGGGSSWVSNAISLATRTVSAVINNISSLPQKVFNEFMNIGGKINQAINGAVNAAKNFGNNIKNAVLGALGIHSPGIVQNKIATEFENTVGQIDNQISAAQSKANEFGSAILDGFNSNDMNKLNVSPNVNANVGTSIDTAEASTSLNDLIVLNSNAFNNIVSNEQESMNTLTSDVDSNLNNLQLKEQSSLDTMTNHISKSMTKILDKTKSGLKSTTSTTQTNLYKMQNSTAKTTSAMIKAWEGMKNSIVGAAKKIKTNSSTWFDSLSTTISSFYNKLQHPGGAGPRPAGGGTNVKRTTIGSKSPFKKVNSSVVSKKLGIDIEYLGNNTTASNVKGISIMDLVNSIIDGTKGAGSWYNVVNPNVSYIKGKARNWDMKGPKVWGKYPTGLSFKVKEFENNVPNISFNTFKGMAEDVFSACNYDFYYDSEKYGSWQKAFSTGSMNCSDSTDALIWMANQCGLPASKVHGHWNQYGHYWANIAGHKMDTTGWMTRGTWTPSASHAGSPKNEPFENLTQSIKDIATDTNTGEKFDIYTGETVSSEVTVNGELKVIHEFKNLPKGVSAEEVARIVNETTSSDDWQKTLVNSVTFQSEDSKVKTRLQKKQIRARGV